MSSLRVQDGRGPTRWLGLAVFLVVCFGAASLGALFMTGDWYAGLRSRRGIRRAGLSVRCGACFTR